MRIPHRWTTPLIVILLLFCSTPSISDIGGRTLVLLETGDREMLQPLIDRGARVHWRTEWQTVALLGTAELGLLPAETTVLLDHTPWGAGEDYYLAINPVDRNAEPTSKGVDVLHRREGRWLLRAAPETVEPLAGDGWDLVRIPREPAPMPAPSRGASAPAPVPEFGGLIDEMVGQLSTVTFTATDQSLVDFGTRYTYADENLDAGDWIYDEFAAMGLAVERHEFTISSYTRENIIATIPGQVHPDEVVFIIAHYDSISDDPYNSAPGADDNGTGTTAVIEAARVLSGYTFERTVKFGCFSGEEQGLVGSWAYVSDIAAAGMNVVGCINFDMIGFPGSDPAPPDLIIYTDNNSLYIANLLRDAALHYFPDDLEPIVLVEDMSASDHAAFWYAGYPAVFGIECEPWTADFNPYYHTTNDTMDHVDFEYAADVARAGVAALADMAVPLGSGGDTRILAGPGAGPDNPPLVRAFPPVEGAAHEAEWTAYGATGYGVNVAAGNVDGQAGDEVLTGAGPGAVYGPHVRGFEVDGTSLPGLSFLAYGTNKFGVNVTAGDLDGDGRDEIVTGAGPGAVFGPHVRAFTWDGSTVSPLAGVSYFAYGTPQWGVNVAAGDIDGDGADEIVTGPGPGNIYGPHVRGWNVDGGSPAAIPGVSFLAYGTNKKGVRMSCGDIDGDGIDEIVTGPGPSPVFGAHIRGWNYDGATLTGMAGVNFMEWPVELVSHGARVCATTDLDGDGRSDIVVGAGPDPHASSPVWVYGFTGGTTQRIFTLHAFGSEITHGSSVAAGSFVIGN
jgi:hypothetical protein